MQLVICEATEAEATEAARWHDSEGATLHDVINFEPGRGGTGGIYGWAAFLEDELVAYASIVENKAHEGILGFIVSPDHRRQGIAKTFIHLLLERPEMRQFSRIIGTPHFDHTAALKVLHHTGFHQLGYDDDGRMVFERR